MSAVAARVIAAAALWLSVAAGGAEPVAIVHYDARIKVDVGAGTVSGSVTVIAVARGGAASVQLDSGDLVIDAVTAAGHEAAFTTTSHHLTVEFPQRLRAGERVPLQIAYHGAPRYGMRFFPDRGQVYTAFSTSQWLPCVDAPDQKATLRLTVTGAGASGEGSGKVSENGTWTLETPTSTYLFGFALGRFHRVTETRRHVRLTYLSDTYSDAELRSIFRETPGILAFFEERSGVRYPGDTYAQVLAAGSVEQEAGRFTLLSEDYGRTLLKDPDDIWLEAHEFAHQWWGNGVTCRDWTHFWLNEGMATFMADAYKERRFGRAAYEKEIAASRTRYERVRAEGHDKALVFPDWSHPTAADRVIVYHKGAYVLHLLREQLGDTRFWTGIRAYTRAQMGRSVTTADFQREMERATGADLREFFQWWVYSTP